MVTSREYFKNITARKAGMGRPGVSICQRSVKPCRELGSSQ